MFPEHFSVLSCKTITNSTPLTFSCLTYDKASGMYEMGSCVYSILGSTSTMIYTTLPKFAAELNEFTCGGELNRNGTSVVSARKDTTHWHIPST